MECEKIWFASTSSFEALYLWQNFLHRVRLVLKLTEYEGRHITKRESHFFTGINEIHNYLLSPTYPSFPTLSCATHVDTFISRLYNNTGLKQGSHWDLESNFPIKNLKGRLSYKWVLFFHVQLPTPWNPVEPW